MGRRGGGPIKEIGERRIGKGSISSRLKVTFVSIKYDGCDFVRIRETLPLFGLFWREIVIGNFNLSYEG